MLEFLLFGHRHKWKILENPPTHTGPDGCPGAHYAVQCEKCGRIKSYRVG